MTKLNLHRSQPVLIAVFNLSAIRIISCANSAVSVSLRGGCYVHGASCERYVNVRAYEKYTQQQA